MASYIKQGESIFVPFKDGKSIYDSQNRPRIYKTVEAFKKSFPVHNFGTDGIVLTEYVPNEQPTVNVVRCKDCISRNIAADLSNTVLCTWLHNLTMPKDGFCSYGKRSE